MTSFETIVFEPRVEDGIARITLNRPEKLNAMTLEMCAELELALRSVEADDETVVVIVRGEGRAFCVGMDLDQAGELVGEKLGWEQPFELVGRNLWRLRKVSISQVNGDALGSGQALAIEADITIASEDARFGYPDTRFGMAHGLPHFYNQTIGPKRTKEYFFTGRFFSAREAYEFNLINHVVPRDELERVTLEMARDVVVLERKHPGQVACMKVQINRMHPELLLGSDPYTVWAAHTEREYVRRFEQIKGSYYETAASDGRRAMIGAMDEGHAQREPPGD